MNSQISAGRVAAMASAPEEPPREVQASMSQLALQIGALDDSVNELLRRLNPVMRQEPVGKGDCISNSGCSTPLADAILYNAYRVSGVNDNVRHILSLLEI